MAARRLSVDVANLSYRLAILESARDEIIEALDLLNPDSWTRSMAPVDIEVSAVDVAGPNEPPIGLRQMTIVGYQCDVLERVLVALQGLL